MLSAQRWLAPAIICVLVAPVASNAQAQSDSDRINAQKYLQVLLRRPRPGVALDRVYGYHVQSDSLDDLKDQLLADESVADIGSRRMVWGLIQLTRGRGAEAAEALAQAEASLPEDAACSFYLGRALLAIGQTENAAKAMERAIERGPARAEALPMFTELGRIYSRAGENEKSLAVWSRLEELFPGDTKVGGQIARTLADEGNIEAALERFERLASTSRRPDEKVAFAVQVAEMRRRAGDADKALGELETILSRLRPGSWLHSDVRNRIEAGFLKSGDYDALADYYQQQLKDRPDDLSLQTRLSTILISAGRLAEAKELLEAAIRRAPQDAETRLALIDLLISQNAIAEAGKQFEQLAKNDPDNPDHLIRWGQVLLEDTDIPLEERRDGAVDVWSRLAKARGDDAVTLSQIADRMRGIQRSEQAIELYKQSIEVDPKAPQYREYLGEYLHSLDRKEEAIEAWKQIAGSDRKNRESLVRLAEVFGAFEQDALALETWREASSYDLNFAEELRYAAKLVEAKRYDDAFERYEIADKIADSPDEREQLLRDRITAYQASGTLEQQIEATKSLTETPASLRTLALLYGAAGDSESAERAIRKALVAEPDNIEILLVAADIAETQNRLVEACELFEKLAAADNRFRSNYLQRVANLNVRIGRIDRAMEICEAIIDANPASPESYQFLARTAFGVQRDEPAIAALRRAMSVAPRDNLPRRMLAGHFADRFRTDEAIELYWQIYRFEAGLENKIGVIGSLGPLYDRKSDMDSLISRIKELNRKEGDSRTTALMIAAAHESVQDFGAAREAIEPLLAAQPRDVALLQSMVRLSDAADEVEIAAEYQKRITDLADTPENRFRLIQFQLDAGLIDVATALSQRISFVSDPARLGGMVRSAMRRGDLATARALCQEAIKSDASLWDMKLLLAQMLLSDQGNESFEANRKQAIEYARDVRQASVAFDAKPPSRPTAMRGSQTRTNRSSVNQANPIYWSQSYYQIASIMRVGPYASGLFGNSRGFTPVEPQSFGHARVIAASLILVNEAFGKSGDELSETIKKAFADEFSVKNIASINDPATLWEQQALLTLESSLTGVQMYSLGITPSGLSAKAQDDAKARQERMMELTWRLAEVDPQNGTMQLLSMLMSRQRATQPPVANQPKVEPLSDEQLESLIELNKRNQKSPLPLFAAQGLPAGVGQMMFQGIVAHELSLAGQTERADSILPSDLPDDASYWNVMSAVQFWLTLEKPERAERLLSRLLPAARSVQPTVTASTPPFPFIENEARREFTKEHQQTFVDAAIALHVQQQSGARRRSAALGNGQLRGYLLLSNGARRSIPLQGPLSTRLLDNQLVQSITSTVQQAPADTTTPYPKFELPEATIAALEKPLEGASVEEQKTRSVLAAYAHWWADRPEECYESLVKLCDVYPSDVDLQIERARLASVLKQPKLALEALDSFSPLDSKMLVRKEMAAMNLAAELGDIDRAKTAAERLFGMRLDVQTQLALADQLGRLGLKERAEAMLQRTRSGRARDASTQIRVANAFLASGNKEVAAEVAYALFRRLSTGRSQQGNAANYRQQVVSILRSADRLEPLIERAKRRVESTPKAIRPKLELAELYTAAGRNQDANALWESLTDSKRVNTQQLLTRAEALVRAKKYDKAIDLYLDAFEKEPQRINNDIYRLTNTVRQAGEASADKVFARLLKIPVASIPSYRLSELVRMGSRSNFSEVKRKYIGRVLKSAAAQNEIYNIARSITESERKKIPEYRDALIRAACSPDAFVATSNLWRVRSRSSGGTANGPLADIIGILSSDEESEKAFRKAAKTASESEGQQHGAEFLVALLNVQKEADVEVQLKTMRKLVAMGAEREDNAAVVSSGLLWQAGQLLEKVQGVPPEFLVDLYSEAKRCNTSTSSSSRYTVDNRLIQSLVAAKRAPEARDRLMAMYRETDNSSQNQHNPGYGDYQNLQSFQWIGEQLIEMDGAVEALVIFKTALGKPDQFERAKRWGGSRNYQSNFQDNAKKAADKVTSKVAAEYLIHQIDQWEENFDPSSIVLMETSLEKLNATNEQTPSILTYLIAKATEDEEAEQSIGDFAARLKKLTEANTDSWRLAALSWITAHARGEDCSAPADALFKRLPNLESLSEKENKVSVRHAALLSLFPVAKLAIESEEKVEQDQGARLVRYLEDAAGALDRPAAGIALAALSGDAAESINRVLGSLKKQIQPGRPVSEAMVLQCLNFASEAIDADNAQVASEALTLALGGGPPLRKITATADPFALNQATPRPNQQEDTLATIKARLTELLASFEKEIGVPLTTTSSKTNQQEFNSDAAESITQALLAIAMPSARRGTFFPYAKRIASTQYDRINSRDKIEVQSVSLALANIAAASGRSESVFELLQARLQTSAEPEQVAAAMVQVGFACRNGAMCEIGLKELEAALDGKLPNADQEMPELSTLNVITSQVATESQRKSLVVDVVLQATWPIVRAYESDKKSVEASEFQRKIAKRLTTILIRTEKLIRSDNYTVSRHGAISQRIKRNVQRWALYSGDPTAIDRYIQSALAPLSGMRPEEKRQKEFEGALLRLLGEGMINNLDQAFRQATEFPKNQKNYVKRFEPQLCLMLQQLPREQRIPMLEKITLGRSGKEPIAYISGLVHYELPPELVRAAQPSLDAVLDLPTCTDDFPVVNSLLLLIDDAVETKQEKSLAKKLTVHLQTEGDTADIALSLIKLGAGERDGTDSAKIAADVQGTLDAITKRLAANRPTKSDTKLAFPELETIFALRAARAGVPIPSLEPILRDAKTYAIRGQRNWIVSAVSRATAKLGIGRTADGALMTPLKHFDVVAMPPRFGADSERLRPLFSMNEEGWVSGTSGYGPTHLMLKFPLKGTFEFSATIRDGSWGECDVAYGGIAYQAQGWNKTAKLVGMGSRGEVAFPVPSVKHNTENVEAVSVTPLDVKGVCNGEEYAQDIVTNSFPFASIMHLRFRTTQFKDIRITGSPTIPEQVQLIDPTMRGWGILARGRTIPKMLLPIGPKQNREQIEGFREKMEADLAKGPLMGSWSVVDGELHYKKQSRSNAYDPSSQIQYLRPLQDGESITIEYFAKEGSFELSPSLGRLYVNLTDGVVIPSWIPISSDLASTVPIATDQAREAPGRTRIDIQPKDNDWNTIVMARSGKTVSISLNDQLLTKVVIQGHERPGIYRNDKSVRVRSIVLRGENWPSEVPADLMARP